MFHILLLSLISAAILQSCDGHALDSRDTATADSLLDAAHHRHDYQRLLELADSLQSAGSIAGVRADYWRGYAYSRQRMMRLAEKHWKQAVSAQINSQEELEYYAKSANRLSGLLILKSDYNQTMSVSVPALERLDKSDYIENSDYASLLATVGCCLLKKGTPNEAAVNFNRAYDLFIGLVKDVPAKDNFTAAIVGVITITENYLQVGRYREAFNWTMKFKELLDYYKKQSNPDEAFVDKQQTRLNIFHASALEGLGRHAESVKVFEKAMESRYAETTEGRLEANTYLMKVGWWDEAARNYDALEKQLQQYGVAATIDAIQLYLLPKYRANMQAGHVDAANDVSRRICDVLDSAVILMQHDAAMELTAVYNTQQREKEFVEQRSRIERHRYLASVMALVIVVVCSSLIIYSRHQSAMRLEMAYSKLEMANERIKESARMKTSFIQQISHEIRTPLNILSGFTQVITTLGIELDEDTRKDINNKIVDNTKRITELVNKMLELSDVSSKTVIEKTDHTPVVQIAAEAINVVTANQDYTIPIDLRLDDGMRELSITTNVQAATRAVVMLLDNAERFTKEGSVTVSIGQADGMVRFVVEDTGIGVPPSEAEHIFEEFVQLNEYEVGTGIGLTVARSICRRLGGDVVLDTSYTGGARFVMALPVG